MKRRSLVTSKDSLVNSAAQSYLTAEFTATVSILVEDDGVHHEHISIPAKKLELYCSAAMAQQAYFDFKDVTTVEISMRCVGRDEMAALNFQYRGKNSPTNVLSFESDLGGSRFLRRRHIHRSSKSRQVTFTTLATSTCPWHFASVRL